MLLVSGDLLVTGGFGSGAQLWDLSGTAPRPIVELPHCLWSGSCQSVATGLGGRCLATANPDDNAACLWDLHSEDPSSPPMMFRHEFVRAVAISPDGRWLVTGAGRSRRGPGDARVWELGAQDPTASPIVLAGHEYPVTWLSMSRDSRWLATAAYAGRAQLWDLTADDPTGTSQSFGRKLRSISISPDGQWFVTGGTDGVVRVWELTALGPSEAPVELRDSDVGSNDHIWLSTWSPDSRWLATAGDRGVVFVWDFGTRALNKPAYTLTGHQQSVRSGAFSATNRWLATGVTGNSNLAVRLWDLQAESPMSAAVALRGRKPTEVAMSPDERWLITGSSTTTQLWDLGLDTLLGRAQRLAGRELNSDERKQYFLD